MSASGPRLCEKAKTLDRDRTSHSFNTALGVHAASPFKFEIEFENIILVPLRVFEFSHSLGPSRHFACALQSGRFRWKADIEWQAGPAGLVAIDQELT
jgi:hypothetical protein